MAWIVGLLICAAVLYLMCWAVQREAEDEERFEDELLDNLESRDRSSHLQERALEIANAHTVRLTRLK